MDGKMPLVEKYRPQSIGGFIGLDRPKRILSNFARQPKSSSWLFIGPAGTGKTSMALALAREIGAELIHIASQQCTVDAVKEIGEICRYGPISAASFGLS